MKIDVCKSTKSRGENGHPLVRTFGGLIPSSKYVGGLPLEQAGDTEWHTPLQGRIKTCLDGRQLFPVAIHQAIHQPIAIAIF